MSLMTEQHISAQEWTCDRCGGHDPKSCGCAGATATSREIQAAKKEAHRQACRKSRVKSKAARYHAPVEKADESPPVAWEEGDDFLEDDGSYSKVDYQAGVACRTRGFRYRAQQSKFAAEAENFRDLPVTKDMLDDAIAAREAWIETCHKMERLRTPPISTA